jgi:hypothetical protein
VKEKSILTLSLILLFTGCQPSVQAIQTADAQTQAANPTYTSTPVPTLTSIPTPTPTPIPSSTPDVRIINTDIQKFLLQQTDLPPEGRYYLPAPNWSSPHHNFEIIQDVGQEIGNQYINETGRVDGWYANYVKGHRNNSLPVEIHSGVVMFSSIEGAKVYMEKYVQGFNLAAGYVNVETDLGIGDSTAVFEKKDNETENYVIEFSCRNFIERVLGIGIKSDADKKLIVDIAYLLLNRLQNAPVSDP